MGKDVLILSMNTSVTVTLNHDENRAFYDISTTQEWQYCSASFWPGHSKLKRPINSATLTGNPFYRLTSNLTFTKILT